MPSNQVDYGTPKHPNLEAIAQAALDPIAACNRFFKKEKLSIRGKPTFALTSTRGYTACSTLGVFYDKEKVADFTMILFSPGDGTGGTNQFYSKSAHTTLERGTLLPLAIPKKYQHSSKLFRVFPQRTLAQGILCEIFLPLLSVNKHCWQQKVVSLEQLTIHPDVRRGYSLVKERTLGTSTAEFSGEIANYNLSGWELDFPTCAQLTCGYYRDGTRFGDPCAIYYNSTVAPGQPHAMQVAGFITVRDARSPVLNLIEREDFGYVPLRERQ